jgi:hypothetical protein
MSKRNLDIFAIAGAALIVAVFCVVALAATRAHGALDAGALVPYIDVTKVAIVEAPASQPPPVVIAPVAASGGWAWFLANAGWLLPLVITLLSSVSTGLSDYPAETPAGASRLKRAARVLRVVAGCLSVVQFRNAPGSLKSLLVPPSKP